MNKIGIGEVEINRLISAINQCNLLISSIDDLKHKYLIRIYTDSIVDELIDKLISFNEDMDKIKKYSEIAILPNLMNLEENSEIRNNDLWGNGD